MPIDTSGKNAYASLVMCLQEFEDAALKSNRRAGYLAVANGATYNMDAVLEAQERSLNRVSTARSKLAGPTQPAEPDAPNFFEAMNANKGGTGVQLIEEDVDFAELFGDGNSPFANYLEDCIGCNLRLKFDWQLQPINLLGPINGFLDQMNLSLDKLLERIDPLKFLEDICWALNHFATLCPQDIILVLMGIKALLKKYLMIAFNIKLDWTVLLGPILKALVQAVTDLLDNIFALLMAPLDCALSGLNAANDLMRAGQDFLGSLQTAGNQIGEFMKSADTDGFINATGSVEGSGSLVKDISWTDPGMGKLGSLVPSKDSSSLPKPTAIGATPGQLNVSNSLTFGGEANPTDALRIPAGFILTGNATIKSALEDPSFPNATWLERIIIPLQECIAWIKETFDKILGALHSLEGLVGGGISFSMDNISVILFIKDIISLLMLVFKLITSNDNIKDWCSYLQANPQVLENAAADRLRGATIEAQGSGDNAELIIKQGPDQIGVIKTCVNSRTAADSDILSSWVRQVESFAGAV